MRNYIKGFEYDVIRLENYDNCPCELCIRIEDNADGVENWVRIKLEDQDVACLKIAFDRCREMKRFPEGRPLYERIEENS